MPTHTSSLVADVADRLEHALTSRVPIRPVREMLGDDDIAAAYAVQHELVTRRIAAGGVVVGRKIGLTSPAVQRQLGVNQPDFGFLFADMKVDDGTEVPSGRLLQPRIEAEMAFLLRTDLTGDHINADDVRAAVDYTVAALEIVDSRITNWDLTIADTIADNASSGLYVLGDRRLRLDDFDPVSTSMRMYADGDLVSQGSGAECLGDPITALTWLARTAVTYGTPLRAGQLVLSGALGPMVPMQPGKLIQAEIGQLGTVTTSLSSGVAE